MTNAPTCPHGFVQGAESICPRCRESASVPDIGVLDDGTICPSESVLSAVAPETIAPEASSVVDARAHLSHDQPGAPPTTATSADVEPGGHTLNLPGEPQSVLPPSLPSPLTKPPSSEGASGRPADQGETLIPPDTANPVEDPHVTRHHPDHSTNQGRGDPTPAAGPPASQAPNTAGTAKQKKSGILPPVAGYELIEELGRGGMGVVYKARHLKLNRVVALKMILAGGRAGRTEMARFHAEAEAVAQLHHANIVQVFEVGEQNGQPFFSLEYVEGGTLEDKAASTPQPPRQAARVVELLAGAMEIAHQRGILHRDLKPANVLLEGSPDTPLDRSVPKITDFGLAKKLEGDSGQTRDGAVMGTPSFMAPEQAQGKIRELGPAADVYSLGAILYDLLTGGPPFRGTTAMDTLRQVIHNDPVPPAQMQPGVPRDLQTICLKCLEKEPKKRYAAAGDLAADLRRFLSHRPILARATPVWERLGKWSRRHPTRAVLAAVSVVAALALGTGGYFYAAAEERRATVAHQLQERAERNEREAVAQKEVAEGQRRLAVASLQEARDAIDVLAQVGHERLANVPHLELVRREILQTALAFQRRFVDTHGNDPALRQDCGRALLRAGEIHERLGDDGKAEETYREARQLFDELIAESPGNREYRQELAAVWNDLAILHQKRHRPAEAEVAFAAAIRLKRELASEFPEDPACVRDLANSHANRGNLYQTTDRPDEAERDYRAALNLLGPLVARTGRVEDKETLARTYLNLGALLTTRQPKGAAWAYDLALPLWLELRRLAADDPRWREQLALTYLNRSVLGLKTSRPVENAIADYAAARTLFAELAHQFRGVPEYRQSLANTCINLGRLLNRLHRPHEAEKVWGEAVPLLTVLADEFPEQPLFRQQLGQSCNGRAIALATLSRHTEAEKSWRDGVTIQEELLRTDATNPAYWQDLVDTRTNLAGLLVALSPSAEAQRATAEKVGLLRRCVKAFPSEPIFLLQLTAALQSQAELLTECHQLAEARTALTEAVALQRTAWKAGHSSSRPPAVRKALTDCSLALIRLLLKQCDHAAAQAAVAALLEDVPAEGKLPPGISARDAAVFLVQCFTTAEKDKSLTDAKRSAACEDYAAQALTLLRRTADRNAKEVADLGSAGEFLPLHARHDFKKLAAEIETRIEK